MNISGIWTYKEDFGFGNSEGEAAATQVGDKVKGTIVDGKVLLENMEVTALQNNKAIDYLLNNFEVHRISENKLVGSTYDSEDVCGVFVLERI